MNHKSVIKHNKTYMIKNTGSETENNSSVKMRSSVNSDPNQMHQPDAIKQYIKKAKHWDASSRCE